MPVSAMHATLGSPVMVASHISKPRTVSPAPVKAIMVSDGCTRRGALTASGAALLLLFSPGSAQAVNLKDAKKRSAERKQEVQKAAQEAAETGTFVETNLTSDKTVPDGIQRGRNSRTGPLSNKAE